MNLTKPEYIFYDEKDTRVLSYEQIGSKLAILINAELIAPVFHIAGNSFKFR